jgi:hypothetical protein
MFASTLRGHRIAASLVGAITLAVILSWLAGALSLAPHLDHAMWHLALGIPALLLLVLAVTTWPAPSGRDERVVRTIFVVGLAVFGGGSVLEATGAFGYDDYDNRVNDLANLHDIAQLIVALGFALTLAGGAIGLALTALPRAANSR